MKARPLLAVLGAIGCSTVNPDVRARRTTSGALEVDGPLGGPFATTEALARYSCEKLTSQPGAANGRHGFEYCALHYYSPSERAYYLSYLSDIGRNAASGEKTCEVPRSVNDPQHTDLIVLGRTHNHTEDMRFSSKDLSASRLWRPTRVADSTTGKPLNRWLMVFFKERTGACIAFSYDNVTRVVSALRNESWFAIGEVYNDEGDIRLHEGQSWAP